MKCIAIFCIAVFLILGGCAVREEPISTRAPKKLITQDDYEDLEIKPRKEEPIEVDYNKEGTYRRSIDTKN